MKEEKLKEIITEICKRLKSQSNGILEVKGPHFKKVEDNVFDVSIKFSMNVPDEVKQLIETDDEEPNYDLMEIRYHFNLNTMDDHKILANIDESFEQAKQKIIKLFLEEMTIGQNKDNCKQKEYVR
jgi:hypothetical protein